MSLGYNTQKPMRSTNLPGSIGNTAFVRRAARRSPPVPKTRPPPVPPSAVSSIVAVVTRTPAPPVSEKPLETIDDDTHWVYGTALKDLTSLQGEVVAEKGDRCLFV